MTITELSIKRPPLIIVIFAFLILLGSYFYSKLNYEMLPNITPAMISVTTVYPGASPKEIESSVSKLIEDAVTNIENIKQVSTFSMESYAFVVIEFNLNADAAVALQEVQRRVNETISLLPEDCKIPVVSKFSINEMPILRIGSVSDMPDKQFFQFMNEEIRPRLARLEGVGNVYLIGGQEREIQVNIDKDRLNIYGISILEILELIKRSNFDFPAGKIKEENGQLNVRLIGKLQSLDVIRDLIIRETPEHGKIRISDVAEVYDGIKETTTMSRLNKQTSLGIMIQKQTDANTVAVSNLVREEIIKIEQEYKDINIKFDVAQDASIFTMDSANAVKFDLLIAVILVAVIMLMFLHSIRNSLIIMIAIPSSLITTFSVMYVLGYTLNMMSLLALSLVIGILVDDSIVVLENIHRHLEMGKSKVKAAIDGRNEIGFTALSITLVDVVVFLPLALLEGIIGNLIRQFAVVMVVSTMMSLFVSFTLTPMLASRFSRKELFRNDSLMGKFSVWFEKIFHLLSLRYSEILKWAIDHKIIVFVSATVLLFSSFALLPMGFIGSEFLTPADKGELSMILELEPGAKLEQTNSVAGKMEDILLTRPEVVKIFTNVGSSEEGFIGSSSNNVAELLITLVPKEERSQSIDELGLEYKSIARKIPGVKTRVAPIMMFGTTDMAPVAVGVNGADYDSVLATAKQVERIFLNTPGTSDVRLSTETGKPELQIEIDRDKLSALGLSFDLVGAELRVALNGDNSSKLTDGNDEYDIRVVYDEYNRTNPESVKNIQFVNSSGHKIFLSQFAEVNYAEGPGKLERKYRNCSVTVMSRAVGRASGDIGEDLKIEIDKLRLPSGIRITYENDLEMQDESFSSLGIAFLAAIIFVYFILVALYNSFIYPLSVLLTIPLAIIGALLGLALTMQNINIMSLLGMIILVGLVGKNAIILVDRINQNRASGKDILDAIIDAAKIRLRPILMTTLTLVFGVLPIALSTGAANELKIGLAVVLIGGLTSSLFLTLILVPVMYIKIDNLQSRLLRLKNTYFQKEPKGKTVLENIGPGSKSLLSVLLILCLSVFFNSQIEAQPVQLTINQAVSIALQNNSEIIISELNRKQSSEKIREAYANLLPEITASGSYVRNTKLPVFYLPSIFFGDPNGGSVPVTIGEKNVYEGSVDFSMPVYNATAYHGIKVSELSGEMQKYNIRDVENTTAAEVKKIYLTILNIRKQIELTGQTIGRADERLAEVKLLFQKGFAADFDTLTAFIGLENLKPGLISLKNSEKYSMDLFKYLIGVDKRTDVILTDSLADCSSQTFATNEITEISVSRRPDIESLKAGLRVAETIVGLESSNYYPSLSAFGKLKIESQSNNFAFRDYQWPTSSHLGLQLSIPIFNGFKTDSKIEQAELERKIVSEKLQSLENYAEVEIGNAIMVLNETSENITTRRKNVELAERNYNLIKSRFEQGLTKLGDLLDAELLLRESKTNYFNSIYLYRIAEVEYERASGLISANN